MPAPTLASHRVRLRAHRIEDLDAFGAFYEGPRAAHMDRPRSPTHLWHGFSSEVGSWDLVGHGAWAVETPDGRLAGQVSITHPPHFAERELGWLLFEGFEGRGLALEAARMARDWAADALGRTPLVSYIHGDNRRSIALAERLGAAPDPDAARHHAHDIVYRHAVPA